MSYYLGQKRFDTVITEKLYVSGALAISGSSTFGQLSLTSNTASTSTNTGALTVVGGIGLGGDLTAGGSLTGSSLTIATTSNLSGKVSILDTTQSTNCTTGALVVAGGAGICGDVNIDGNLTVLGTTTQISSTITVVSDPLLKLADNNTADLLDIGVYGQYDTNKFAGLFRDATDNKFKLFSGLLTEPTTTVNTGASGYELSGLCVGNLETNDALINGTFTLSSTTSSTNFTSGALIVGGGVGIAENLNVGGNVDVIGTTSLNGITTILNTTQSNNCTSGALIVNGGLGVSKNVNVCENFTVHESIIPTLVCKVNSSNQNNGDRFGYAVAVSDDGNRFIVGSPFDESTQGTTIVQDSGVVFVYDRNGTTCELICEIRDINLNTNDENGYSIDLSANGSRIAIGAPEVDGSGIRRGRVYIYDVVGTTCTQTFVIDDTNITLANTALFGSSVKLTPDGTRLVVGSPSSSPSQGKAYVFDISGTSVITLVNNLTGDTASPDRFGQRVHITNDGNRVFIGAELEDLKGAVYVFDLNGTTWSQTMKITASDAPPVPVGGNYPLFGSSIDINPIGTRLVVGALYDDNGNGVDAGSVYVYELNGTTFTELFKILSPNGISYDYFGTSVSVSSDTSLIVIGSVNDSYEGGIFIYSIDYVNTTYSQVLKIARETDIFPYAYFGGSVTISPNKTKLIIGSYGDPGFNNGYFGAVYYYDLAFNSAVIKADTTIFSGTDSTDISTGALIVHGGVAINKSVNIGEVLYVGTYTVATLPSASKEGGLIFVSDETGGAIMAFSDGTNWRRLTDRAIVS